MDNIIKTDVVPSNKEIKKEFFWVEMFLNINKTAQVLNTTQIIRITGIKKGTFCAESTFESSQSNP
ncbi:MAG: hypothetical protein OHK003_02200 [Anaerolineales bacterium]